MTQTCQGGQCQGTGALEKKSLKIGFIPITCATPIIMAEPMGFYRKQGLEVEVVKTAGWAVMQRIMLPDIRDASGQQYVTITLTGIGGHGALPHRAVDPIVAAASIVMALQTIVARNIDPLHAAVVTVGALHAGRASNVIPDRATLELSVRALEGGRITRVGIRLG